MSSETERNDCAAHQDDDSQDTSSIVVDASAELPFLVTQWLSNYGTELGGRRGGEEEDAQQKRAALERVRHAASELASAFSTLGAFGTASRPTLESEQNLLLESPETQRATFADMKRRWSTSPANQLNHLVEAAVAGASAVDSAVESRHVTNLVQAASETIQNKSRNPESGRTLQEAVVLDGENSTSVPAALSIMQRPVVVRNQLTEQKSTTSMSGNNESSSLAINLASAFSEKAHEAAACVRRFLELRDKFRADDQKIRSMKRSLAYQKESLRALQQQRASLLEKNGQLDAATTLAALDEISEGEQQCNRVISQLQRQLEAEEPAHAADSGALVEAERSARDAYKAAKAILQGYRDPLFDKKTSLVPGRMNNRIVSNLAAREIGLDRFEGRNIPRSMGRMRVTGAPLETRRALLMSRLSHAVTINTHMAYPIYCLRFDRTGRYFITGADDYLVKVFCLGGSIKAKRTVDPATYARGAVLVCTLKGHAGVINDIDVSADNSLLATASEDGDCRIWGLKDGCPVAILRGHEGGANMVAWSTLTPFRLVTAGSDGLARTWDVREACLKRYGKMVGKRPEYRLQLTREERQADSPATAPSATENRETVGLPPLPARQGNMAQNGPSDVAQQAEVPLPPLPAGPGVGQGSGSAAAPQQAEPAVPLPPLPAAAANNNAQENGQGDEVPGRFVSNDTIDEGVKLLSKLQHGANVEERMGGPGTRARRSAVKVICVARCPHGGHFATGSDDGICRVFEDDDDRAVKIVDDRFSNVHSPSSITARCHIPRSSRRADSGRLLLTLKGHLSAITDLQYSHAGDRLLTASQKDGVVRIWSWSADPSTTDQSMSSQQPRSMKVSHILIKLTNPSCVSTNSNSHRRGPNRKSSSTVSCDVASWICDDSKIVTSQCELVKQSSTKINAGSQFLFLWDSFTGHCLFGISGAHTMQCPVTIPHPTDPSILCSAGADGLIKIWDCERGTCFFSHKNTVEYGPVDANDRGKISGFLDGAFFLDGTGLVLTDDSGRVTVIDSFERRNSSGQAASVKVPSWMKEQYFANDYYELYYDSNGYCIERGSGQPPHLAPASARCSHGGAPWSDAVNETFRDLVGPIPIREDEARWRRQVVSSKSPASCKRHLAVSGNLVSQYDPKTTILVHGSGSGTLAVSTDIRTDVEAAHNAQSTRRETTPSTSSRRLSSNWRWRDYNDILREEGNEDEDHDSDDEEFELNEALSRRSSVIQDSDSDDEMVYEEEETPARTSSRQSRRRSAIESDDSDEDEDLVEYMSTNNVPSGPFVADYDTHFFRMSSSRKLEREWLRRVESHTSYSGRKSYAPQLGDEVVYIPRAHLETISEYPSLAAPWQSWPEEAVWPVVQCRIQNIRYRFPYKHSLRIPCRSIVAILTLEVTGIPELSHDRSFDWPKPTFVNPAKSHIFELSLFENASSDFIIPFGLYRSRLELLEQAFDDENSKPEIEVFYADGEGHEDTEFTPFYGYIDRILDSPDNDNPNLRNSGYQSIKVFWRDGGDNLLNPWEVNVIRAEPSHLPNRPILNEEEKRTVRSALDHIKELPNVNEVFLFPVDQTRFSDYSSRVEIPLDLTFISNRLAADYYATRMSVVADVKLIRDNCAKYNGDNDELTLIADGMVKKFEEQVLSPDELQSLRETVKTIVSLQGQVDSSTSSPRSEQARTRSTLENLAPPEIRRSSRRTAGQRRQDVPSVSEAEIRRNTRTTARQRRRNRGATAQSSLEDLESLSMNGARRSRGRSTQRNQSVGSRHSQRLRSARNQDDDDGELPPSSQSRHTTRSSASRVEQQSVVEDLEHVGRSAHNTRRAATRTHAPSNEHEAESQLFRGPVRATRSVASHAEQHSDIDDNAEPAMPSTRTRSRTRTNSDHGPESQLPGRTTRSGRTVTTYAEQPVDVDDEHESSNPSGRNRARTRTRTRSHADLDDSQPSGRTTRSGRTVSSYAEQPSDVDDESELARPSARKRGRTRSRTGSHSDEGERDTQRTRRSTRNATRTASRADPHSETSRTTSRNRRAVSYGDQPSDIDDSEKEESGSDESDHGDEASCASSEESVPPDATSESEASSEPQYNLRSPRTRRQSLSSESPGTISRSSRQPSESPRRSARRHSSPQHSYMDPSSSEFGSDAETESPRQSRKRRRNAHDSPERRGKRRKSQPVSDESPATSASQCLKEWPDIDMKAITKLTKAVIKRMQSLDQDRIFAIPVAEAFPNIADAYIETIETPMDFRSILEDRLQLYGSIRELQEDLIRVFKNCIEFNGPQSEYSAIAESMLEMMEDIFRDCCKEAKVRLPRGW